LVREGAEAVWEKTVDHSGENEVSESIGDNSAARLLSLVERFERLDEEVKNLRSDQADILKEAAGAGFDKKVLRKIIAERRMSAEERETMEALLDTYRAALGMIADMPLGAAALGRVGR
jgi:uncharacterized protein (UPF0335 family)